MAEENQQQNQNQGNTQGDEQDEASQFEQQLQNKPQAKQQVKAKQQPKVKQAVVEEEQQVEDEDNDEGQETFVEVVRKRKPRGISTKNYYPTLPKKVVKEATDFSFGSFQNREGKGGGSMSVYFSDGFRFYGITKANYLDSLKTVDDGKLHHLEIQTHIFFNNYPIPGTNTEHLTKYAKILLKPKTPRVMLCSVKKDVTEGVSNATVIETYGITMDLSYYQEARNYIYQGTSAKESLIEDEESINF